MSNPHVVEVIAEQIVSALRHHPHTGDVLERTPTELSWYTVFRERDVALQPATVPGTYIDVRIGQELPVQNGNVGSYTAEVSIFVDLYAIQRQVSGALPLSRTLMVMRSRVHTALMIAAGATPTSNRKYTLAMSPRVISVRPAGTSDISIAEDAQMPVATMRTEWRVRYVVDFHTGVGAVELPPTPEDPVLVDDNTADPKFSVTGGPNPFAANEWPSLYWVVGDAFASTPDTTFIRNGDLSAQTPALLSGGYHKGLGDWESPYAMITDRSIDPNGALNAGTYKLFIAYSAGGALFSTIVGTLTFTKT